MEPTAKNVPKIRTHLLRKLTLAQRNWSQFPVTRFENYTPKARVEVMQNEIDGLTDATNLWVSPEWVAHLDTIAAQVFEADADIVLEEIGLFADSGFVVFPDPIYIPAVDSKAEFPVSAMMWTIDEVQSQHGLRRAMTTTSYIWREHYALSGEIGLRVVSPENKEGEPYLITAPGDTLLTRDNLHLNRLTDEEQAVINERGINDVEVQKVWDSVLDRAFGDEQWMGIGRNDWFFDTAADDMGESMTIVHAEYPELAARHIAIDRTLFWTLNKLLTAERHTERQVRQPSTNKSKKRRKATVGNDEVHIIHLRKNAPTKPTLNPGSGRKLTHESETQGHWKMQPYGPGRSLRKRIWVGKFKRGVGLPPKEQVYSLDR